ncbi:DUF2232 domain-containing protein [Desulfopila sp. IMCC35008]|uniref:DUF2232 domain-containing protein n=1 Tax=Desulfopila sp. IMCC35008 TaxID=2653858 RepID=UPI0013D1DB62|nr:DUF2232 domain-containing protein [Desulfopila sp. IMCC35008]
MEREVEKPAVGNIVGNILLIAAASVLPGIDWALFGWIHIFLPLLVFFFLNKYGLQVGVKYVLTGCVLALIVGLLSQTFSALLVSYSLIPVGYFLARSALQKDTPSIAGLKGAAAFVIGWLLLIGVTGLITGTSPYTESIQTINLWIDEMAAQYQENPLSNETGQIFLENGLPQIKAVIELVLPGLLLSSAFFVIILTMVLGNRLVAKHCERQLWPLFRLWQLPDKLIWVVIVSTGLAFVPSDLIRPIAVNLIIVLSTIYSFQGFAISVFFMNKWNVPILFRSFIYVMLIFQQVGSIILLIIGVFDTWVDFRKLSNTDVEAAQP